MELPLFDLVTTTSATKNFSFVNVIGEGWLWTCLQGYPTKWTRDSSKEAIEVFCTWRSRVKNEIVLISKLQHRNHTNHLQSCLYVLSQSVILCFYHIKEFLGSECG